MLKVTRELIDEANNVQDVIVYFEDGSMDTSSIGFRLFEHNGKEYFSWFTKAIEITEENIEELTKLKNMILKCRYQDIISWKHGYNSFMEKYNYGMFEWVR